jgi:hypothetical protein
MGIPPAIADNNRERLASALDDNLLTAIRHLSQE